MTLEICSVDRIHGRGGRPEFPGMQRVYSSVNTERILELLADRGMTQSALGQALKISKGNIGRIIHGAMPGSSVIPLIAQVLGVDPDSLRTKYDAKSLAKRRVRSAELARAFAVAGLSQASLAAKLEISRYTLAAILSGKLPGAKHRRTIARALGMTVEQLWPSKTEEGL